MSEVTSELGTRIVRVESQIEALTNDVRSLAKSVEAMADALTNSQRTNWGVVFAGVSSMVAVVVLYVAPFVNEQAEIKEVVKQHQTAYVEHISDGHAARLIQLEKQVLALEREQRERFSRAAAYIDRLSWDAVTVRRD